MRKLLIILIVMGIFIGIFTLSAGCTQKSKDNNPQEYFGKIDLVSYSTNENDGVNQEEQFDIQLRKFYDFSQKFFPVCNNYIEDMTLLLEKFNNEDTLSDKITYSIRLREKYEEFSNDLKQINPPDEASEAYQLILNAISKRILFFKEFEKGTDVNTLIGIEKEAYSNELLFWDEINKIYDYYLGKINKEDAISI